MDLQTALLTATSTFGISMAGAYWLSQALINHRLTRALEDHKNELLGKLEEKKAALQAEIGQQRALLDGAVKREVESYLGDRAAQRQYEYEARKRLYVAIGPLRFQLLLACREFSGRVTMHARREHYSLDIDGYYGRSTLYRLLRPIALADLIERQIAYTDFAVDADARNCLRFKRAAFRALSGDDVVGDHPAVDWSEQVEHVYTDVLSSCAEVLISADPRGERVMRFSEFQSMIEAKGRQSLDPFPLLLDRFEIGTKTILWVRLVAYAAVCNAFLEGAGRQLEFEVTAFPTRELILACNDETFTRGVDEYVERINALTRIGL